MTPPRIKLTITGMDGRGAPATELGRLLRTIYPLALAIGRTLDPPLRGATLLPGVTGDGKKLTLTVECTKEP